MSPAGRVKTRLPRRAAPAREWPAANTPSAITCELGGARQRAVVHHLVMFTPARLRLTAALLAALRRPSGERPRCVIAHTVKGKGVSYMEREIGWHLGYLVPEDAAEAVAEIRSAP